jgi:hypothetical protein
VTFSFRKKKDLPPIYSQITLRVIAAAGFGRRRSWTEDFKDVPSGCQYSFPSALSLALDRLLVHIITPKWCYYAFEKIHFPYLSSYLRSATQAFDDLKFHILDMVATARAWVSGGKVLHVEAALLRNLVEANMAQEGDVKVLTDDQLISNAFVCDSPLTSFGGSNFFRRCFF